MFEYRYFITRPDSINHDSSLYVLLLDEGWEAMHYQSIRQSDGSEVVVTFFKRAKRS